MALEILSNMPIGAPSAPKGTVRYADVAVTATAKDFAGIYRNKSYHQPDFEAVLERAEATGVEKVMLTGMSLHDVDFNLKFAALRPKQCYITVGVHPYHASEPDNEGEEYMKKFVETVRDLVNRDPSPLAAYGELGLDYDRLDHSPKDTQIRTFKRQLDIFVEEKFHLPLFLHCRAAFDDFVDIVKPYVQHLPRRGLVHSFVGSKEQMQKLVEMGFDVSVNGFSFRDRESIEMASAIPLEKLQIETDAPWGEILASSEVAKRYLPHVEPLPPRKKRDKFEMGVMVKERNESCCIDRVAFVVAGLKGITVEEVAQNAWKNSTQMFRLGVE